MNAKDCVLTGWVVRADYAYAFPLFLGLEVAREKAAAQNRRRSGFTCDDVRYAIGAEVVVAKDLSITERI